MKSYLNKIVILTFGGKGLRVITKYYNGAENLISKNIIDQITYILNNIKINYQGHEYTNSLLKELRVNGWSKDILIEEDSNAKINGIKDKIGLIVFLGNHYYSYFYLLNLQYMYINNKIKSAIFITQTKKQAIIKNKTNNPTTNSTGNYIEYDNLSKHLISLLSIYFSTFSIGWF